MCWCRLLYIVLARAIGLELVSSSGSPFLWRSIVLLCFQYRGMFFWFFWFCFCFFSSGSIAGRRKITYRERLGGRP